jgi:hypothetical protein
MYTATACICCSVVLQALGLCVGRGPLAGNWSVGQTCLLYIMPIYPAQGELQKKRLLLERGIRGLYGFRGRMCQE